MDQKFNRAIKALQAGNYKKAFENAKLAIRKSPAFAQSYTVAGLALASMDQHLEATKYFKKSLQIDPGNKDAKVNFAQSLIMSGEYESAKDLICNFLEQHPSNKDLLYLLSQCEYFSGDLTKAESIITQAIIAKGNNSVRDWSFRGVVRDSQGNLAGAIEDFETALKLNPHHIETLVKISSPLSRQLRANEAIGSLKTALKLAPRHIGAWQQYGLRMLEVGDTKNAVYAFKNILKVQPGDGLAIEQLAQITDLGQIGELKERCEKFLKNTREASINRSCLNFALAYIAKRQGNVDLEIKYLSEANLDMQTLIPYRKNLEERYETNIYKLFPSQNILTEVGEKTGPTPIYVLGLPRSGTTLTEAILAAHPNILALGERAATAYLSRSHIQKCIPFDSAAREEFLNKDKASLPNLPRGTLGYVDKMPENYKYIGFLKTAYPACRVIHITRDPRDVALSMWKAHFANGAMHYCYDLEAMAHSFNIYKRLMRHWHSLFPGQILDVSYQELVLATEATARKISAFCDVEFSEKMLRHNEHIGQVLTLSAGQVRQPVHSKSIGQWRQYEKVLQPFIGALDYELWSDDLS